MTLGHYSVVKVTFDAHLRKIAVPIHYVSAEGCIGESGLYTTTLTRSKDVDHIIVGTTKDPATSQPGFANEELFLAKDAETLVWKPVLDWIVKHR